MFDMFIQTCDDEIIIFGEVFRETYSHVVCMGRFTLVRSCWHQNNGVAGCASPFSHATCPQGGMTYPLLGELNHDFRGFRRAKSLTITNHNAIPTFKAFLFLKQSKAFQNPLYIYIYIVA